MAKKVLQYTMVATLLTIAVAVVQIAPLAGNFMSATVLLFIKKIT